MYLMALNKRYCIKTKIIKNKTGVYNATGERNAYDNQSLSINSGVSSVIPAVCGPESSFINVFWMPDQAGMTGKRHLWTDFN
jgi:hypothetical protein